MRMLQENETTDTNISTASAQNQAWKRLMTFLDEVHAQMPDVPEEEIQKDIEEAVVAVRGRQA